MTQYPQPSRAIICAAGLGTRFLPQTKSMPKEMLPIIDKPVIQLIVEEVVAAGIEEIIIVTGATKRAIEDHFDRSYELESQLREAGKNSKADQIQQIAEMANFTYVRQKGEPKGNARPVLNAKHLLKDNEPFFVFFADDFFRSDIPRAKQLLDTYNQTGKSVISLVKIDHKDSDKYGMAEGEKVDLGEGRVLKITDLKEKPGPENTTSTTASVGGYLLTPNIMPIIAQEKVSKNGEISLIDSIYELLTTDEVYGRVIDGIWHDTGDQFKYICAVIDMALENPKYAGLLKVFLRQRLD